MHNFQFWFSLIVVHFYYFLCIKISSFSRACLPSIPSFVLCSLYILYSLAAVVCVLYLSYSFIHSHTIKQNGRFSVYSIDTLGHKIRQCFFCCCWITQTAHFHATTNVFCYCCFKTQLNQNVSFFVCVLCTSVQYKAHLIYI